MAKQLYEVIFSGDFREPFFRSTIVNQIQAAVDAGYRTGLLQFANSRASLPARIHQDIRKLIDSRRLVQLDPNQSVASKLLIATDPSCFTRKSRRILRVDAQISIVLVPLGRATTIGPGLADWPIIYQNANEVLSGDIIWGPMTPAVREQLDYLYPRPRLSSIDWHACIDPDKWNVDRTHFCASRPVIGRSGPPSVEAWPISADQILSLYPDDPQFSVRILNGGPILKNKIASVPRNWDILTSADINERDFLSSIDFFVYSNHPDSTGTIDPHLLKAMASGAVAILPPSLEGMFGEGAVYAEAQEVGSKVWRLYNDRARYLDLSQAGVRTIRNSFSHQHLTARIADLIGDPRSLTESQIVDVRPQEPVEVSRDRRRVMFITINGVGMGHLTRMLAIAKRCPEPIEPVFVTMSQALKVLREQGFLVEFIPSRQYLDCDINQWNRFLCDELNEMIAFYDPAVVIFDGNVPYQGVIDAIKANPDPWFIWSRRGMWRSDNKDIVGREKFFDIVVEPGDLAGLDDHGITKRYQERTHHVRPIRLLDPTEMLSSEDARRELGLSQDKPAVLIQLGAGNNYDYRSIHNTALMHIKDRHSDAQIAVGEWLISDQPIDLPETVVRMPGYPFARYFNAFDIAISAVGYNSFHELLFAGIPTIFVPNENMQQDNQFARALYADRHGLAVCVRTKEIYRLTATIDKLFHSDERNLIKSRLARLDPANGAADAASLVHELVYSHRFER